MPLSANEIIWGLVAPAVFALVAVIVGRFAQHEKRLAAPWAVTLAIAGAFVISFIAITGKIVVWPKNAQQILPLMAAVSFVLSIFATIAGGGLRPTVLSIVLVVGTAFWVTSRKLGLEPKELHALVTIACIGAAIWGGVMDSLAWRMRGAMLPFLLAGVLGCAALVLADGGTIQLAKVEGAVAIALLAIAALSLWLRDLTLSRGGILAIEIAGLGLLWCGYLFADVKAIDVILLSIAPLFAWAGVLPVIRSRRPWMRLAICLALVIGVAAIAVVPAANGLRKTMKEQIESTEY